MVELKHDKLSVVSHYWLQDCNRFTGSRISGIFFPLKDEVQGVRLQVWDPIVACVNLATKIL